jgi:short subunit fatty acids transporter
METADNSSKDKEPEAEAASEVDLTLVGTELLLHELGKRFDIMLVAMERVGSVKTDTLIRWQGGMTSALGLAERTKHRVLEQIMNKASDLDDEDDE